MLKDVHMIAVAFFMISEDHGLSVSPRDNSYHPAEGEADTKRPGIGHLLQENTIEVFSKGRSYHLNFYPS